MNKDNENNKEIKSALRDVYNQIQPTDSWEALRQRIDNRIEVDEGASAQAVNTGLLFWRRTALALAACLVLASAFLFYCIRKLPQTQNPPQLGLLTKSQVEHLGVAFSNIRELFGSQQPWMVLDASGKGEIGVDDTGKVEDTAAKIIVLRLAVDTENGPQYYDIVAFADQRLSFSMPLADNDNVEISLRSSIAAGGKIAVKFETILDDGSQTGDTVIITDNRFTSLVNFKAGRKQVKIDAIGQPAYNI